MAVNHVERRYCNRRPVIRMHDVEVWRRVFTPVHVAVRCRPFGSDDLR
jgi:hypothetical protein